MTKRLSITHLFLDIGGVLLTNGWDHVSRKEAATKFDLDWTETENRHRMVFPTLEEGKLSLYEYLAMVIFYKKRPFTPDQFVEFMYAQSKPYPQMINLMKQVKKDHGLKIVVVSNETRELNAYRIQKFKLDSFVDTFISSSFVGVRKLDPQIFRFAIDISQAEEKQTLYIENTPLFIETAKGLGIRTLLHTDYESTCAKLKTMGLWRVKNESK
jgi:putative hydrolase of the HAD superfamily